MAKRTIREFSAPSNTNVPTGPNTMVGDKNFELKSVLVNMVQANPFSGKPNEDVNAHLQHFLEVCRTFTICGVTVFAYSRSHCSGRRNNGFMRSEVPSTHGISA
jgi:hypothetical protein